jgi:energy-coupling factor transport system substrate-specific component
MATLALIPSAVAFNVALAYIVVTIKLPIYLDCVGIIITTLMAGLVPGLIVVALAFPLMAIGKPNVIFFTGTGAAMAIDTDLLARVGGFKNVWRAIPTGIGMGILSAAVSAPVNIKVFGGVTSAGSSAVTAFFLSSGKSLIKAAFLSGASCDPIDKICECILAIWLIRSIPHDLLARFHHRNLDRNFKHRPAAIQDGVHPT